VQRGDALGNAGDKRLNKIRESYEQGMAGREFVRRTDAIYFNDLGIDALIGDEMHAFKNLYAAKNRFGQTPKFLGGQGLSNRALDMSFKSRWVRDNNDGLNVFGLTATPTKNSPLEIYSMLSHIAPEAFDRIGVRNSEEFLDRFCEFRDENILTTTGNIESALVTVGFKNLDELRAIMFRYIDRKTAEDVGLILPTRDDRQHLVDMSAEQKAVYAELREMADKAKSKDATGEAHIFSIMDKMAKVAMDLELYDSVKYAGAKSPKYAAAVSQIVAGAADGGQVVFADNIAVHEKLVTELVASGIPRDQIGIINAQVSASSTARQNIAEKFNSGKLKVVIGNTATMGEGINLQKGTTDIHHLDLPWDPASMQQRNGRGLRQGNLKESVRIHTYLAKGSFDGYRHQSMRAKKDWMDLLWNGGDRVENLAREGAMSRDDLMVMLAADPEAAREQLVTNKAAAEERFKAQQTTAAVEEFNRFREMKSSWAKLKSKETPAAERLKVRIDRLKLALSENPHFPAKDALDGNDPIMLQPSSGVVFRKGVAFEVPKGDSAIHGGGKFVVTGLDPNATHGDMVEVRRYGAISSQKMKIKLDALASGIKPFEYSQADEEAEYTRGLVGGEGGEKLKVKDFAGLRSMPPQVLSTAYDAIQKHVKDGTRDFSFHDHGSAVGLLKDGKAVLASTYSSKDKLDDHDVMLPMDSHRQAAMDAFLETERGKSYGYEYRSGGRRSSRDDKTFVAKFADERGYHSATSNPWGAVGDKVFGQGFSTEARARFEREQQRAAANAKTLGESISALAPTATGQYSSVGAIPQKSIAMMWAKARRTGVLDTTMAAHVPAGRNLGDLFTTIEYTGGYSRTRTIENRTVRDVLLGMAKSRYPDLAAAMLVSADNDPEAALSELMTLKEASAIRQGVSHLVSKHPHLADRKAGDFGKIEGTKASYSYGGSATPAHPLHERYGPSAASMTLGQLAGQEDARDAA
jgi:superfamily II DNA or RNA helicase